MSVAFVSPSMRASASDLTVSVSPLGLVELADELARNSRSTDPA